MKTLVDFVVNVEAGRNPIVLQLTDLQIIDASQCRTENRLSPEEKRFWALDKLEERCYRYIREVIRETQPDLILLTGDMVYGEFDDSGERFLEFVKFMEGFRIPWAPIFGNHDAESAKGADWQCEQLHNAKHCLFRQRTLTGNGNYTVGIEQGGILKRIFVMMDSNGSYHTVSEASLVNGHTTCNKGFGEDQILWLKDICLNLKKAMPDVKISLVHHIQQYVFKEAFSKYGFTNEGTKENPINIDLLENREEGDFGYLGNKMKSVWDKDYAVWNRIKDLGFDSVFVGHEHSNSASVVYQGIRFQYGQKSSEYDRFSSMMQDGTIVGGMLHSEGCSLVGGTVIPLNCNDGSIDKPYIYLCNQEQDR